MTIEYRVYGNAPFLGGPVDRDTPLATVAGLTWDAPPLPADADATFVVLPRDTATGLEGTDAAATIRVRLDGKGEDVAGFPMPPMGLSATPLPGGSARLDWTYPPRGGATGFHVYLGIAEPDLSAPVASVGFPPGAPTQILNATLSGLTGGVTYAATVRAFNHLGEESNAVAVAFAAITSGPAAPESLSGSATP